MTDDPRPLHGGLAPENVLRQMLQEMPAVLWTTDCDLRFTSLFGAGLARLRVRREEVVGITLPELLASEGPDAPAIAAHRRALRGEVVFYEQEWAGRMYESRVAPLRDEQGQIVGCTGFAQDVTQRKQTEQALRDAQRLASIGTLAAGIAHEVNNPLAAIVAYAAVGLKSQEKPRGGEAVAAALRDIRDEALRCGQIVKSVLQFTRQEESEKWPQDFRPLVQRAKDLTRKLAADQGVSVLVEPDDELPQPAVNPTEMQQVMVNLIANAVQASAAGDRVTVRVRGESGSLRVEVEDAGCGMTGEQLGRVFDPFYTTRRGQGGTGLGLSITHNIIGRHGGTIDVRSSPGKGTTVTFVLPPAAAAQATEDEEDDGAGRLR